MTEAKFKVGDNIILKEGYGSWLIKYKPRYNKKKEEWEYVVDIPQYHFMSHPTYKKHRLKESEIELYNSKDKHRVYLSNDELSYILKLIDWRTIKNENLFEKLKRAIHKKGE